MCSGTHCGDINVWARSRGRSGRLPELPHQPWARGAVHPRVALRRTFEINKPGSGRRRLLTMMNVVRPAAAFLLTLLAAHPAAAQRIDIIEEAKLPRFEVASVKPGDARLDARQITVSPGRLVQENMPLWNAVSLAFDVRPAQLANPLPDLITREPFTIDARLPVGTAAADSAADAAGAPHRSLQAAGSCREPRAGCLCPDDGARRRAARPPAAVIAGRLSRPHGGPGAQRASAAVAGGLEGRAPSTSARGRSISPGGRSRRCCRCSRVQPAGPWWTRPDSRGHSMPR